YSNGLTYVTKTIENKTGFIVTGWDNEYLEKNYYYDLVAEGKSLEEAKQIVSSLTNEIENGHIVIPNYIGNVPVIGVGASSNLNFGKITLSRNTVWLGEQVFYNCKNLKEVDFNNANIKQIPTYGFANTSVGNIELPSSVTIFKDYAFSGVKMTYFNVSNAKYIGRNAFDSLNSNYVHLPKTVTYVGDAAFRSSRVYIEHETYPTTWASTITTTDEINGRVITACKLSDDYIYSVEGGEVTVYQYLGSSKKITIPSMIEEKPVTEIGYGFATRTSWTAVEITDYDEINDYIALEEVVLPEGIKSIGDFALCGIGLTVFAPNSLEEISETFVSAMCDDTYNRINLNGTSIFVRANYLALAGNDMPTVVNGISHTVEDEWTKEKIEASLYTIGFGINKAKVEEDSNFYYINDGESYSLMSYKGLKGTTLTIPSTFNEKPVLTILSKAIGLDSTLEGIKIENGIVRIRPLGICSYNTNIITIPLSMLVINADGIYCKGGNTSIYVAASSKPVDWDSNWTNRLGNAIFGINGDIKFNNFFVYSVIENQITLISYIGKSSNVYIPRKIDEIPVSSIKTGFYKRNGGAEIYIPSSITTIESKAFVNASSKKFVIHSYAQEVPSGWDSNWYFNSYRSSSTSYVEKKWEETALFDYKYNDEYAYSINDDKVALISYCGNRSTVKIPRTIEGKNVDTIKAYCFYFDSKTSVYIPNEVTKIEQYGLELYSSSSTKSLEIYCEASSQPGGWNYSYAYNSYNSSNYYISTYFGRNIGY
ncbi:MAG: leucine-rich repeat domain-containing protein, partial [Mollicutes bacterium]|nr:leucine-rich repeat domain-containing protein [Mollicutes bacterium]